MQNETEIVSEQKTNASMKWTSLAEIISKIIVPLMNMVLSRLLAPAIFGIIANVTIIVSFAQMFAEGGFSRYIVQFDYSDKESIKRSAKTALTTTFIISLLIFAVIVIFRDPFASFVNAEGYGLILVIAAVQIPLYGFISIQTSLARRYFEFKKLTIIRIISAIIQAVVSIVLAILKTGPYSIAIGTLSSALFQAVALFICSKQKIWFGFSFSELKKMLSYSLLYLLETLFSWLNTSIDVFIIGKLFDTTLTGIYKNAFTTVVGITTLLGAICNPVLISYLSRLQNNKSKFAATIYQYQRIFSTLFIPMAFGILCYRSTFALIFFGSGWGGSEIVIGALGFCLIFKTGTGDFVMTGCTAKGKPQYNILADALYSVAIVICCLVFGSMGFEALAISRGLCAFVPLTVSLIFSKKSVGINPFVLIKNTIPAIVLSGLMYLFGLGLQQINNGLLWSIGSVFLCMIFYFVLLWLFDGSNFEDLLCLLLPQKAAAKIQEKRNLSVNDQSSISKPGKTKNLQINGLRAVLCLLIVLYHYCYRFFEKYGSIQPNVAEMIPNPIVIVGVFFLISGFFLHYKTAKDFIKAKLFNIYLPFVFAVIIIWLVRLATNEALSLNELATNLLLFPLLSSKYVYVDGAHWYIVTMLLGDCFFLFSSLLSHWVKKPLTWLPMLIVEVMCFAAVFTSQINSPSSLVKAFNVIFQPNLLFMIFGYFLALYLERKSSMSAALSPLYLNLLLLSGSFVLVYLVISFSPITLFYFCVCATLFGLALVKKVQFFENKILQMVGDASLFIYLFHQNLGYYIIDWILSFNSAWYPLGLTLALIFAFGFGIGFSLLYHWITQKIRLQISKKTLAKKEN
ncbi:MAG: Lipopolysaccharide biosynthesis protein WzxC [bacterium ADurb.BinA186]|nr:MAG: Lipopolysaccharide biosynthesis protein WzxC [bacterium ADurb.BinA186]